MPNAISMPRLSDTMEVGTIVKWHVKPGQTVKSGDVIADIETDKATMEQQTFDDGTVAELKVAEGQSVPVGTVILTFVGGSDAAPASKSGAGSPDAQRAPSASPGSATPANAKAPAPAPATNGKHSAPAERVFASPLARKIAAETGIDLSTLEGTGPSGRIIRKDVEAAAASPAPATAETEQAEPQAPGVIKRPKPLPAKGVLTPEAAATSVPPIAALVMPSLASALEHKTIALSNMRRTIAARLVESKTTIPHYQVTVSARMDALIALRAQLNEQLASQGVKLSVNDFLVRACALSMHAHPFINSRWVPTKGAESIELLDQINVGVAIALPLERGGGLVVATIRSADQKGLRLISQETRALADKARKKGLTIEEMADSTFTISNLGMYGVDHFTAIINPPNAAILAVGGALEGPVVETGPDGKKTLALGTTMSMTLSSDHRIIDGAMAAQYLTTVKEMLEKPATLLV